MNRKIKVVFVLSILFNVLVILCTLMFVYKKGGISYVSGKIFANSTTQSNINVLHEQRNSLFNTLEIDSDDVVFLGDSLTQRNEWCEEFQNLNIKNRGIDSETTLNIIDRIGSITNLHPKKIFLMIGINDLQNKLQIDDIIKNYDEILSKIKNDSPNTVVYVQSVLPVNNKINSYWVMNNNDISTLNSKIQSIVKNYNYNFIDLYSLFIDDNVMNTEYTMDGVHLNGKGYQIWVNYIKQYIN